MSLAEELGLVKERNDLKVSVINRLGECAL
jgi:hypothetical protein